MLGRALTIRFAAALLLPWLAACGSAPPTAAPSRPAPPVTAEAPAAALSGGIVARSDKLLVYVPVAGDTFESIAARHLGGADRAWQIAEANRPAATVQPGQPLVLPLVAPNPLGVTPDGVQAIPVLCYHRLGQTGSRVSVSPAQFEAQMEWLRANDWRVVRLADLAAFIGGKRALPPRSVVITFDDGYESVYRYAFPLLKKQGFPATMFLYTDFVGARDALSWAQMEEMLRSGLVDIQSHSKTHRNLSERGADDNDSAIRNGLDTELRQSRTVIERRLGAAGAKVQYFAYPYGDANEAVLDAMRRNDYELGFTVTPGTNPFYASPLMLRRVMIFGDHDLEDFRVRLTGRRPAAKP